jgi:hypothetical protein
MITLFLWSSSKSCGLVRFVWIMFFASYSIKVKEKHWFVTILELRKMKQKGLVGKKNVKYCHWKTSTLECPIMLIKDFLETCQFGKTKTWQCSCNHQANYWRTWTKVYYKWN